MKYYGMKLSRKRKFNRKVRVHFWLSPKMAKYIADRADIEETTYTDILRQCLIKQMRKDGVL